MLLRKDISPDKIPYQKVFTYYGICKKKKLLAVKEILYDKIVFK